MDWPEAVSLIEHWRFTPPVNEILAMALGMRTRDEVEVANDEADLVINRVSKTEFDSLLTQHGIPPA
jgi:hypothetical protein